MLVVFIKRQALTSFLQLPLRTPNNDTSHGHSYPLIVVYILGVF